MLVVLARVILLMLVVGHINLVPLAVGYPGLGLALVESVIPLSHFNDCIITVWPLFEAAVGPMKLARLVAANIYTATVAA
jgi:hypothetical protein